MRTPNEHKRRSIHTRFDKSKEGSIKLNRSFKGKFHIKKQIRKTSRIEHIGVDKSEISDERSVMNIGGIIDTAEKGVRAAETAKDAAASTVRAVNNSRKTIQTGVVYSARQGRALLTSVKNVGFATTAAETVRAVPKTAVKAGKGIAKIAGRTAVRTGFNAAKGVGGNVKVTMLNAHINKDMVYDTGIETAKQGITYVRRMENTRKAIKNANKARKIGVKTVKTVIKALSNKVTWIILAVIAILLLCSFVVSFFSTALSGIFGGLFGWASDKDSDTEKKLMTKYTKYIDEAVKDAQKEIDDVYNDFQCDRREYGDHGEITEFRDSRFTYAKVDISKEEKEDIIAIAAVKWYAKYIEEDNELPDDMTLKKDQIQSIAKKYYSFEHHIEYDYCPHHGCCHFGNIMTGGDVNGTIEGGEAWYCDTYYHGCKEIKQWIEWDETKQEWIWDNVIDGERNYCDNPNHEYLAGKVENYSTDQVLNSMGFTSDQKDMYEVYREQIIEWMNDAD